MAYPIRIARLTNFARLVSEGLPEDWAGADAELNQILVALGQVNDALRGITTADGSLRFTQALREMSLIETITATGVAGASQSVVVPAYNTATDKAEVFVNGLRILPANVAYTDATHITVTYAFVGGEKIVIDLSSNGAGALTSLASTAINLGASLVGINDAGSLITATTVEGALQEIFTALNTLMTNIGTIANYIKKDGTVTFTANQSMGGHKLTNGAAATAASDFVIYSQLTAYTSIWDNLAANFLALGGGTMGGEIAMGSHKITGMADPTAAQDAATKAYVDSQVLSVTVPIGGVILWTTTAAPSAQYLLCDGSAVSRAAYPTLNGLLAAAGYPDGNGDSTTTFNLPDMKGRVPVGTGAGAGLTVRVRGATGGEEAHVNTKAETPPHTHTLLGDNAGPGTGVGYGFTSGTTITSSDGSAGGLGSGGAAAAHNNMQPYRVMTYIIRVA